MLIHKASSILKPSGVLNKAIFATKPDTFNMQLVWMESSVSWRDMEEDENSSDLSSTIAHSWMLKILE